MSLVRLENVTKRFGGEPILDGVDFRVEKGEKIGLIGRNGSGKSTVFRLITGGLDPDGGRVERMRKARIACLEQLPQLDASLSILDVVMQSFEALLTLERELAGQEEQLGSGDERVMRRYGALQEKFELRGGYTFRSRVKRVLHGLGFAEDEFGIPVSALSGGQRTRLMLALVLLEEADLLLLDEPENHLDIAAREWLEGFLTNWPRSFVIISHDRGILNAVATRIVEVERGTLAGFTGNYDAFCQNKALTTDQQRRAFTQQQAHIEKEERWINRFRYKNTKARQVQSRIKRLEKLERFEAPVSDADGPRLSLGEVVRSGQVVLDARDLSMAYGGLRLYEALSFEVQRGERVGIIGPNGCGKTTLLRQLAGQLPEAAGTVTVGHKVRPGAYDQHHADLSPTLDVFSEVRAARPDMTPQQVRTYLGRFLFSGDDVFKPISALSGGELSRTALAKLILGEANLLLLDEPTNHLDVASREALEAALEDYPGTIILVTHDRALIDRLVNKLVIIENGAATVHLGNYSDYRWKQQEAGVSEPAKGSADTMKIRAASSPRKRAKDRQRENLERKRQRDLDELEEDIAALEETLADMQLGFADLNPDDYERVRSLQEEYEGAQRDLKEMYDEWERLADGG